MSANDPKKSLKSKMDDTFRDYMRRKIELQRKQIGLVLPGPITPCTESVLQSKSNTYLDPSIMTLQQSTQTSKEDVIINLANHQTAEKVTTQKNIEELRPHENVVAPNQCIEKRSSAFGMQDIVNRLQERHGMDGYKYKLALAKRKRHKSSISSSSTNHVDNDASLSSIKYGQQSLHVSDRRVDSEISSPTVIESKLPIDSITTRNRPDLFFLNTIVLINGFTDPPNDTLMRMLQRYGRDVEKYETDRVTHIIAEQLSSAKEKIYKKQRRPIPVVHPRWIIESVEAGRKLPYSRYILDQLRLQGHIYRLHLLLSFRHPKSIQRFLVPWI